MLTPLLDTWVPGETLSVSMMMSCLVAQATKKAVKNIPTAIKVFFLDMIYPHVPFYFVSFHYSSMISYAYIINDTLLQSLGYNNLKCALMAL
jgi:hypothetical protein